MCVLNILLISLMVLNIQTLSWAGQDETCTMDDQKHKAHYHCPDGYEVVYTGEGEKECDGSCYKKGDTKDLHRAVVELLSRRMPKLTASTGDINRTANQLLLNGEAPLFTSTGKMIFRLTTPRR
jgi:hypothetical protein